MVLLLFYLNIFLFYNVGFNVDQVVSQASGPISGLPYLAKIIDKEVLCYGSIIGSEEVVTSATCMPNDPKLVARVVVKMGSMQDVTSKIKEVTYDRKMTPSLRERPTSAVIKLSSKLKFSKTLAPISFNTDKKVERWVTVVTSVNNNRKKKGSSASKNAIEEQQDQLVDGPECEKIKKTLAWNSSNSEEYCVIGNKTDQAQVANETSVGMPVIVNGKLYALKTCCKFEDIIKISATVVALGMFLGFAAVITDVKKT